MANPKLNPFVKSPSYQRMEEKWELINNLLGGTLAMRNAGEKYLPKHPEEDQTDYSLRLEEAYLNNFFEETLHQLSSKPFEEPVKPNEDVVDQMLELLEDIDTQGNNIDVFCRGWFQESLGKAFAHVLIDFPRTEVPEGRRRTLEDDQKDGVRPYWVLVRPEEVIHAETEIKNGKEFYMEVRLVETFTERDGFQLIEKLQLRILRPGVVEIWRPKEDKNHQQDLEDWIMVETWNTSLTYVPMITFYTNRHGVCEGKPPLEDLAHINVAHWQSTADQRHILKVSRFPILACSGASGDDREDEIVTIGPNKVLYNEDSKGKFYYVEHTGAAVAAGEKDLDRLEEQGSRYGNLMLTRRTGNVTATGRALDTAKSNTDINALTVMFEDAISRALAITADWIKLAKGGGTVTLAKDQDLDKLGNDRTLDALLQARQARDISRKTFLTGLILRDVLPDNFDFDGDKEELMEEIEEALGKMEQEINIQNKHEDEDDEDEDEDEDEDDESKGKTKKKPPQENE